MITARYRMRSYALSACSPKFYTSWDWHTLIKHCAILSVCFIDRGASAPYISITICRRLTLRPPCIISPSKEVISVDVGLKTVFGLAGGLALFLYGMERMSDALQKMAGDRMRRVLGALTRNPVTGVIAGAVVTAVLQSSSATTVMVIGFVSAGLLTLPQGISVIFGANIGTTITAQFMAFKLSNYIYPIIFVGFLMNFVAKRERIKEAGLVLFSFGLLFQGIEIMGGAMKPLAASQLFIDMMERVAQVPVLGIAVGTVMTLIVQSSSATIAVLQNFASTPGLDGISSVIGLPSALAILLGDNIGTTITALLASIGGSRDAKRTALSHCLFNISGGIFFLIIMPIFAKFVVMISPSGPEHAVIARQIANAHTAFNVTCTLMWLPLLPLMTRIVRTVVSDRTPASEQEGAVRYIDDSVLGAPSAAIYLVSRELDRLGSLALGLFGATEASIGGGEHAEAAFKRSHAEASELGERIAGYISRLFSRGGLTEAQSEQAAGLLSVTNDVERICARCGEMADSVRRIRDEGRPFSDRALAELSECLRVSADLFDVSFGAVRDGDADAAERAVADKKKIRKLRKRSSRAHLKRVKDKSCGAAQTPDLIRMLAASERIADCCASIAEEAADGLRLISIESDPAAVI